MHPGAPEAEPSTSEPAQAARPRRTLVRLAVVVAVLAWLGGAHVVLDRDGTEAARFGAATSGQVVLYDAQGKLQFSGGITGARGHVGDNSGEERVVDLVNTGKADGHDHAVYGCGLHDAHPRTDPDDNT